MVIQKKMVRDFCILSTCSTVSTILFKPGLKGSRYSLRSNRFSRQSWIDELVVDDIQVMTESDGLSVTTSMKRMEAKQTVILMVALRLDGRRRGARKAPGK